MRFFAYPVLASLIASSLDLSTATPACPAITYTSGVTHSDAGLTFTFQPDVGQARPDWVVAHITKNYPTASTAVNLQVNAVDVNQTSPGASYNSTSGLYSWVVAPAVLQWLITDTPAMSFSYGVNQNGAFSTCDTDVTQPSNWFTVKAACPSTPYTQLLNVTDSSVYVSFTGNPGYAQSTFVDFHMGRNCPNTNTITSEFNFHAQDINSNPSYCGYLPNTKTWYCDIPKAALQLKAGDQPCVQSTYLSGGMECLSMVTYPGFAFQYQMGNWTTCSATCGSGLQTRTATCIGNDGTPDLTGYSCNGLQMPATSQACNTQLCPVWVNGTYSACSATCGGGTQTRAWRCMDPNTNQQLPNPSACASAPGVSSQVCNTNLCPGWNPSAWSLCSTTCGAGVQTRDIVCALPDATVDATGNACASSTKPVSTQVCTGLPCPTTAGSAAATSSPSSATGSASGSVVGATGTTSTNSTGANVKKTKTSSANIAGASLNIVALAMAFLSFAKLL